MKRSLNRLLGTTALIAIFGLPVALAAATRTADAASVEIEGIVRPVTLIRSNNNAQKALGFVDSQGEVLLLKRDKADRAAYQKARGAEDGAAWVHLTGVKTTCDGVPAVRVQQASVA
jgi:hypothetical protein